MRINKDYAREIVRVAATGHAELIELCDRLRQAMELDPPAAPAEPRRKRRRPACSSACAAPAPARPTRRRLHRLLALSPGPNARRVFRGLG